MAKIKYAFFCKWKNKICVFLKIRKKNMRFSANGKKKNAFFCKWIFKKPKKMRFSANDFAKNQNISPKKVNIYHVISKSPLFLGLFQTYPPR